MVVSKRDISTFELRIGDGKINNLQKFNYLDRLEGEMCEKEGRRMDKRKHFNAETATYLAAGNERFYSKFPDLM